MRKFNTQNLLSDEAIKQGIKDSAVLWTLHREKGLIPTKKTVRKLDLEQLERDGKRFLKNKGIFVKEE